MTQTTFIQISLELIEYVRLLKLSRTQYDLFGQETKLEKLTDIKLACLSFGIKVTGEEMLNEY
ncbi:hypothetical protein [Chroococcus sp. FPU101]|uniref:hypothetical protein n=1 Tax=Chroococcus sp. FPU101 TaxID=1974212 RepID=UPI001A9051CD|nr:hypothetical protein [Chroococcus sp. FPU101]GFE72258.1 hypothetical protein CFPU101_48680 [Chroococcus sp. FPU101]